MLWELPARSEEGGHREQRLQIEAGSETVKQARNFKADGGVGRNFSSLGNFEDPSQSIAHDYQKKRVFMG